MALNLLAVKEVDPDKQEPSDIADRLEEYPLEGREDFPSGRYVAIPAALRDEILLKLREKQARAKAPRAGTVRGKQPA